MSVKDTVKKQYQEIVDEAASSTLARLKHPPEGWIASVRKALGMSTAQLGKKIDRTRANISAAEKSEQNDRVTLKTMHTMAEAMGCRFVYAIIPAEGRMDDVIEAHARKKAKALVGQASTHMALEKQSLSNAKVDAEIERITQELLQNPPPDFWADA